MSDKGVFRNLQSRFRGDGSPIWPQNVGKLRACLRAFATRRAARLEHQPAFLTENTYLISCYDRAMDAHTIDDAAFWHGEIVSELSVEMQLISDKPWPAHLKARILDELTEQQDRHAVALDRLMRITSPLLWRP